MGDTIFHPTQPSTAIRTAARYSFNLLPFSPGNPASSESTMTFPRRRRCCAAKWNILGNIVFFLVLHYFGLGQGSGTTCPIPWMVAAFLLVVFFLRSLLAAALELQNIFRASVVHL